MTFSQALPIIGRLLENPSVAAALRKASYVLAPGNFEANFATIIFDNLR